MSRLTAILAAFTLLFSASSQAELAVGDPAPDFALQGSDGRQHRLADFRGRQAVVLAWFPRAHIDRKVRPASSAEDMLANLERLGVARRAGSSQA